MREKFVANTEDLVNVPTKIKYEGDERKISMHDKFMQFLTELGRFTDEGNKPRELEQTDPA